MRSGVSAVTLRRRLRAFCEGSKGGGVSPRDGGVKGQQPDGDRFLFFGTMFGSSGWFVLAKLAKKLVLLRKSLDILQSRSLPLLASQEGLSGQLKSAAMVDGGVVLAGWTDRSEDFGEQEPRDFFAAKLDVEGSLVWRWKVRRLVKAGSERDGCLAMVHGTER